MHELLRSNNRIILKNSYFYVYVKSEVVTSYYYYVYGRAEINIKPWEIVLEGMVEGNKKIKWKDREPYAYWRGNPHVSPSREDLMKCNVSDKYDWLARLYEQASLLGHILQGF